MFAGKTNAPLSLVPGIVVTVGHPGVFPVYQHQRMNCSLKDVCFGAECGFYFEDTFVPHSWMTPSRGAVEEATIDGMPIVLLDKEFKDGCIVTRDYGSIPVAFHPCDSHSTNYLCMLVVSDDQLTAIRAVTSKKSNSGKEVASAKLASPASGDAKGGETVRRLQVGDHAPKLMQGRYVQGAPVASLESGKVYVVEFWATWCGPCRKAIPHLNKLHEKFKDQGLVVIGQNVWERGEGVEASVMGFVKQMGSNMTYRVALDGGKGDDGKMAETWMKAAGRGGIPTAFVVNQSGIIVWIGHPMSGLDDVVEKVLAGTFDVGKEKKAENQGGKAANNK